MVPHKIYWPQSKPITRLKNTCFYIYHTLNLILEHCMRFDMYMISASALYASIFGLAFAVLSWRVSSMRMAKKIPIFDGGDLEMGRAIRVHGNFIEYVPIFLVMLMLYELMGGSHTMAYLYGFIFLLARVLHAYGLGYAEKYSKDFKKVSNQHFRAVGAVLTYLLLVVLSFSLFWKSF